MSATLQSPCMGCDLRELYCHSYCAKYADYKNALEAIRQKEIAEKAEIEFTKAVKNRVVQKAYKKGVK